MIFLKLSWNFEENYEHKLNKQFIEDMCNILLMYNSDCNLKIKSVICVTHQHSKIM